MIGNDEEGNDFTSGGGMYPHLISSFGDIDTNNGAETGISEKQAALVFIGCMIFVFVAVFGGLAYMNYEGLIPTIPPNCKQEKVLAAYLVDNGGSPYYAISLADYYGNIISENYWQSVPYIGEILNICS